MQLAIGQHFTLCFQEKSELNLKDTLAHLNLPVRPEHAIGGAAFTGQIASFTVEEREKAVVREILSGNVPSFSRKLKPLKISQTINGKNYELIIFVASDYMAVGSGQDYMYIPMTPATAQLLADTLHCLLPTKKMVDIIYAKAGIKLRPQPIPPSDRMTTVPVFMQHTDSVRQQIRTKGFDRSASHIIAGHKKDIIISNEIYSPDRTFGRVVIYGWHRSANDPIQPVYNGHDAGYADYSHGVRLISRKGLLNGVTVELDRILTDPALAVLLSDEGVISKPFYPKK